MRRDENEMNHLEFFFFFFVDNLQEYQKEFLKDNILTVKSQRRFESEMLNIFTEKVSKIALSANDDKVV